MALWTLADLTAAQKAGLWFDAQNTGAMTVSGGKISAYADGFGGSVNWTEGNATYQPPWGATGWDGTLPCVTVAADARLTANKAISSAAAFAELFVFTKTSAAATYARLVSHNAAGVGSIDFNGGTATGWTGNRFGSHLEVYRNGEVTYGAISNDTPYVALVEYDGTNCTIRINGVQVAQVAHTTALAASWHRLLSILSDGSTGHRGKLAEYALIIGTLSTDDRDKIEGYAAWRWGREADLPSGHAYESAAPTVSSGSTLTGDAEFPEPSFVGLVVDDVSLDPLDVANGTVTVLDQNGDPIPNALPAFSQSGIGSVTVNGVDVTDASGELDVTITGSSDGALLLSASVGTMSSAPVSITVNGVEVISVTVSPSSGVVYESETLQLSATVSQVGGASTAVTWSVVSGSGATVNSAGLVSGVTGGNTVTIRATSDADATKYGEAVVSVLEAITSSTAPIAQRFPYRQRGDGA